MITQGQQCYTVYTGSHGSPVINTLAMQRRVRTHRGVFLLYFYLRRALVVNALGVCGVTIGTCFKTFLNGRIVCPHFLNPGLENIGANTIVRVRGGVRARVRGGVRANVYVHVHVHHTHILVYVSTYLNATPVY
jgi:hypothetical protein